jgi:hypothetical protein
MEKEVKPKVEDKHFVLAEFDASGDIIGLRMQGVSVFQLLGLASYLEVQAKADLMKMREIAEQQAELQSTVPKGILKP